MTVSERPQANTSPSQASIGSAWIIVCSGTYLIYLALNREHAKLDFKFIFLSSRNWHLQVAKSQSRPRADRRQH
ncbi:hypothetical protein BCR37DRAFT_383001 [Protomyces lactucae-debilis]|uniref:Uncharacterized protein n=1 Tax=Protomyces lactucae-debilis TaxID=2754530 RepID=A0A1Y2EZX1_PROLT|nr:uncharacterized protein BCR37DRAFT_383001 [Protomyces lactucae-debilis]ORY77007.1 hypothetical protein BCR37DRAFT_383001 [Protomyces lactucae-debilis]